MEKRIKEQKTVSEFVLKKKNSLNKISVKVAKKRSKTKNVSFFNQHSLFS